MTGVVEREDSVFVQLIDGITAGHLIPFLTRNVALSAQLVTDGLTVYSNMGRHFARHHVIEHNDTYVEGEVTPTPSKGSGSSSREHRTEHTLSTVRRMTNAYAAEACYKYNNRADDLFDRFLR